jgi:hypothetical protein
MNEPQDRKFTELDRRDREAPHARVYPPLCIEGTIMNTSRILAVAALAAAASFGAQADEADASQYVVQFQGSRTRAEVKAEAVKSTGDRSIELASAGTQTLTAPTTTDRATVRAETIVALRHGQIPSGERSL